MAKMILSMDGLVLKEIELSKERMTIGRRPHNDVVIDNLAVSGEHAVVVTILNDSFLEDLGSTNGTTVNGQSIKKHFLQNNDVVELGKYKLKYVAEAMSRSGDAPVAAPRMPSSSTATSAAASAATASQGQATAHLSSQGAAARNNSHVSSHFGAHSNSNPVGNSLGGVTLSGHTTAGATPAPGQAVIQILNGSNAGKELVLSKPLTTLGRPGVQVAVITRRGSQFYITHVEGSSFPVVNGKMLGVEPQLVNDHDIIELSGTKMEFYFS